MKKRIIILAILAAAGLGYWVWSSNRKPDNRILVSGNLELTKVDLAFKIAGRVTTLNVREGDWVKPGEVIAQLDQAQLDQQKARDQAAVIGANSTYKQLTTSIQFQEATLEADITAKRAGVNGAQAKLDELLNGSRPQDIEQAQSAVNDARAQSEQARADWDRAQTLFKNDDISKQQFDQYRARFDSTTALLKQAQEKLSMVQEGPRKEVIAAARADVAQAQAALQTAEANHLELRRKQEELQQRDADIQRNVALVGISQAQIDDTTAASPIAGVVLVKSVEVGDVLAAGTTIATIGDVDHPWLRAYINETDLGRIQLGQKVRLSTDSFPGKAYWGHISFISSEAEFTPKQIQTKEERVKLVYRIKIDVDNQNHELKNNMPVDAEIVL